MIANLIRRPIAVLATACALLCTGIWALSQVPLEWVPKVELPEIIITATWPGASPNAVERYVTVPIEQVVQGIAGTAQVESYSESGQAFVRLKVSQKVSLVHYSAAVREQLKLLRTVLPRYVVPRLDKAVPERLRNEQGFVTLQLTGSLKPEVLRRLADEQVAPKIRSLPGVAQVDVQGGRSRELLVAFNADLLAVYGVDPGGVARQLAEVLHSPSYGRLDGQAQSILLQGAPITQVQDLASLIVQETSQGTFIRLQDIADVSYQSAPTQSISRVDGQPVVTLTVDRAPESHMIQVAQDIQERLGTLQATLPGNVRLMIADDRSEDVRGELRDLAWRGSLGLILVILVLGLMLHNLRAVCCVLFGVAVSLAIAFILLKPLGLTLNLLTISGLVLIFGLLVDNAVIVIEQIMRERTAPRNLGMCYAEIVGRALRAVWLPLLGGTLTTMVIILPLVYLSSDLQAIFLPFGMLTVLALGASLISAGLLIPVIVQFLQPQQCENRGGTPFKWLEKRYRIGVRFPRFTLLLLLLLVGIPLWLLPDRVEKHEGAQSRQYHMARLYNATLGSEPIQASREVLDIALGGLLRPFIQNVSFSRPWGLGEQQDEIFMRIGLPSGANITETDSLLQKFERLALGASAVRRTLANVNHHTAWLRIQFHDDALRTSGPYQLRKQLIDGTADLADVQVSISGLMQTGYARGDDATIYGYTIEALGPNYEELAHLTERFAKRLDRKPQIAAVSTTVNRYGFDQTREILRFTWGSEGIPHTRATVADLMNVIRPRLVTSGPSFRADIKGEANTPVRLIFAGADDLDVARFVEQPLVVNDSLSIKMTHVSHVSIEQVHRGIERINQQYRRYIRIDYRGPHELGRAAVEQELAAMPQIPGYRMGWSKYTFFDKETERSILWLVFCTIGLVLLVTASVFESWYLAWVVLLSVPTAFVGVAVGFLVSGIYFTEGAFIGALLLLGIAANDSILLAYRYKQLQMQRPHTISRLLVLLAVRDRLYPMWTTTLTTAASMIPLMLFPNQNDFWMGLAVTVVCGLMASTLLAPIATTALITLCKPRALGRAWLISAGN